MITCLSDNFNITDTLVNSGVINVINAFQRLDKEQTKEVLDALWKALANIDYRQLLENSNAQKERFELVCNIGRRKYIRSLVARPGQVILQLESNGDISG